MQGYTGIFSTLYASGTGQFDNGITTTGITASSVKCTSAQATGIVLDVSGVLV